MIDIALSYSAHSLCVSITSLQDHLCNTISNVVIAQSAANAIMDLMILALPFWIVLVRLHMSLPKKLQIAALISTGGM